MSDTTTYHIAVDGQQMGPYTLDELWGVDFAPDSLVWRPGMADWQRADAVADLRVILAGRVAPEPEVEPDAAPEPEPEPETFEIKVPDGPQRVQPVTVYPGPFLTPEPVYSGSSLPYAAGAYPQGGDLATGPAVTSMVLGITALVLSFMSFCIWFVSGPLAIAAIVTGHIAHRSARRGISAGGGMALAGLICGYFALALTGFFMFAFFSAVFSA